jgi:nitrate reductase alpha subunit
VHLWPLIVEARRNGAKFYVIDPVRNRTGRVADRHFAIKPGPDLALALGMIHVIFETGLQDHDYVRQHTVGSHERCELGRQIHPDSSSAVYGAFCRSDRTPRATICSHSSRSIRLNFFGALVSDSVRPGVVRARSVRWNKFSPRGLGVNSLTSDRLTDIGGVRHFIAAWYK